MTLKLAVLLEAARRATWDALHGPRHLRSGRFRPTSGDRVGAAQRHDERLGRSTESTEPPCT
jgi:hypothetical protein